MNIWNKTLTVIDADRAAGGVIVTFSDGKTVLYHTHFLYDVASHDGNIPLVQPASSK